MIRTNMLLRLGCILLSSVLLLARPIEAQLEGAPGTTSEEILVGLSTADGSGQLRTMLRSVGEEGRMISPIGVSCVRLHPAFRSAQVLRYLRRLPGVRFAELNAPVRVAATPNDPKYPLQQWALPRIQADRAWELWRPKGVAVLAILDTGIDSAHPDLRDRMLRVGGQVVGYNALLRQPSAAVDDHGHGTHCAGIAAAQVNNAIGIAGVAGWNGQKESTDTAAIQLMPVKVLSGAGHGTLASLAAGITWAVDHGARVISMSLGATVESQALADAVEYAAGKGCVLVAAAGNSGTSGPVHPAALPGVLSVAATERDDTLAGFSSWGEWVLIAAPGRDILSTLPSLDYGTRSGTSMACPHVAGAAALLIAQEPGLTRSQVMGLLQSNVDPVTVNEGRVLAPGAGRLNVLRALHSVVGGTIPRDDEAPFLVEVAVTPPAVGDGATATGQVTLSRAAPPGGAVVAVSSDHEVASVPESVTVPYGTTATTFPIRTLRVGATVTATISATFSGVTKSTTLQVTPGSHVLERVYFTRATVFSGGTAEVNVILTRPAPLGGIQVELSSSNPTLVPVPATLTVPPGSAIGTVNLSVGKARIRTSVVITATHQGVGRSATLDVRP
jgi:thermitase